MEVISREIIKPSSPTPPHLKILPLSVLDHFMPHGYIPLLLFYESKSFQPNNNLVNFPDQISKILKESLSQLLSIYYPFTGRLMRENADSIVCNDQGVTFLITHFKHINLSHILQNPNDELINPLFPDQLQRKLADDVANDTFIAIQINHFACGGIAIAICFSHKVGDFFTYGNFVKDWAIITKRSILNQDQEVLIPPQFNGASIFPCGNLPIPENKYHKQNNESNKIHHSSRVCKRRLVFESSKIKSLKELVKNVKFQNHPSRVQMVSALIYKCFVSALRSSINNEDVVTHLHFMANLRGRISPPPPNKSLGNMALGFDVTTTNPKVEEELSELVRKLQHGISKIGDLHANVERNEMSYVEYLWGATPQNDEVMQLNVTSWCKFGMYDNTDFGWGKPTWVTTAGHTKISVARLMDTRDGEGIEAHVSMEEEAMALFESNEELLHYASINPSVSH